MHPAFVVHGSSTRPCLGWSWSENVINTHRLWFEDFATVRSDDAGGAGGVLVVKASQRAIVLTDFVMTHNVNTTDATFRVNIRRGPASNANDCDSANLMLGPYVSPDETVSINLVTGLRLLPGEQLCVAIGGAPAGQGISMAVTGCQVSPSVGP
ncbi:MAG: hypothetical protein AAF184_20645 [Pseudomonadota bacterium]